MATAVITLRNGARISLVRSFPFFFAHLAGITAIFRTAPLRPAARFSSLSR